MATNKKRRRAKATTLSTVFCHFQEGEGRKEGGRADPSNILIARLRFSTRLQTEEEAGEFTIAKRAIRGASAGNTSPSFFN